MVNNHLRCNMEEYNPHGLIEVIINNNKGLYARAVAFDSESDDPLTLLNSDGGYVIPTVIETTCPDCGALISKEVELPKPPFGVIDLVCAECNPEPETREDPFINPLEGGIITIADLDPDVVPADNVEKSAEESTVASRIKKKITKKKTIKKKAAKKASKKVKKKLSSKIESKASDAVGIKKKLKESAGDTTENLSLASDADFVSETGRVVPLEPVEGINQEEEFDDNDLVD